MVSSAFLYMLGRSSVDQSDGNRAGTLIAQFNGRVEVESTVMKVAMEQRKTWSPGRLTDLPLLAQEMEASPLNIEFPLASFLRIMRWLSRGCRRSSIVAWASLLTIYA